MKKTTKAKRSILDERQEEILLRSESKGYWLAFWMLVCTMFIQLILQTTPIAEVIPIWAGEWIVFMTMCIWMCVRCIRNNIWDRKREPSFRTNLIYSLVGSFVVGILCFFIVYMPTRDTVDSLIGAGFGFFSTFVLCIALLSLAASIHKAKKAKIDAAEESEGE